MRLFKTGRLIFGLTFAITGILYMFFSSYLHILGPAWLHDNAGMYVFISGLIFLTGSIGIIFEFKRKWSAAVIAVMLLLHILLVYIPAFVEITFIQQTVFLIVKDIGLLGSALLLMRS